MAEFVQTMKDWKRMCNAMATCNDCPMYRIKCWASHPDELEEDFKGRENVIMQWAAEHPEPVYPTFAEWLNSIGVTISDQPFPAPNIPVYVFQVNSKMFDPIPTDIAEKLGIKPKEG